VIVNLCQTRDLDEEPVDLRVEVVNLLHVRSFEGYNSVAGLQQLAINLCDELVQVTLSLGRGVQGVFRLV